MSDELVGSFREIKVGVLRFMQAFTMRCVDDFSHCFIYRTFIVK